MSESDVWKLAHLMKMRRSVEEEPYMLVLGSGATLPPNRKQVYKDLKSLSTDERYVVIKNWLTSELEGLDYLHLAMLIGEGFFKTIVTTDPGSGLEEALQMSGFPIARIEVIVIEPGGKFARIRRSARSGTIRILKIRGELRSRKLDHFLPSEALLVERDIQDDIASLFERDAVIIGVDDDDYDLMRYVRLQDTSKWLINPVTSEVDSQAFSSMMDAQATTKWISGIQAEPNRFFADLESALIDAKEGSIAVPEVAHTEEITAATSYGGTLQSFWFDRDDFRRLSAQLANLPEFRSVQKREYFIDHAFFGAPWYREFVNSLNLDGAPHEAAHRVVTELIRRGQSDTSFRTMLGYLIDGMLAYVGDGPESEFLQSLFDRYSIPPSGTYQA